MKKSPFLIVFSLLLTGSALGALRGDWQSAGAPIPPYFPAYKFMYICQAELTDKLDREGDGEFVPAGRPYRLYAVKKFEVDNQRTYSNLEGEWQWVAQLLDVHDRASRYIDLRGMPKGAFSTAGHSAGLQIQPGEPGAQDKVTLSAQVKLSFGEYYFNQNNRKSVSRRERSVEVRAAAYLTREDGQPEPMARSNQRELFVVCDKKK